MKPLTLSFSPCPNDTFMFDALIHQKVNTEGLEFRVEYEDIERLNQNALKGIPDITKLSTKALSLVLDKYLILNSGAAMGFGVGPLLLAKKEISNWEEKIQNFKIGIPGQLTTANFLLDYAFPSPKRKVELVFSQIEQALMDEEIDLGLVIHEGRFTYASKGLHKLLDLGTYWEEKTGLPIPLAAIAIKKTLDIETQVKVDRVLKRSIEFALSNPDSSLEYTRSLSQEMNPEVVRQHIKLYVNSFSLGLGHSGKSAIIQLFETFQKDVKLEDLFLQTESL